MVIITVGADSRLIFAVVVIIKIELDQYRKGGELGLGERAAVEELHG